MKKKLTFMIVGGLVAITFIFAPLLHKHLSMKKTPITNNIELEDKSSTNDSSFKKNVENSSDKPIDFDKRNDSSNNIEETSVNSSDDDSKLEDKNYLDVNSNPYEIESTENNDLCTNNSVDNYEPISNDRDCNYYTNNIASIYSYKGSNKNNHSVSPKIAINSKNKSTYSSDDVNKAIVKPTSSKDDVSKSVVKPNSSNDDVSKPVVKPTSSKDDVSKPVVKPTSSNDDVSKPVVKPNSSNDDVIKPVVKPTSSNDDVSKPVVKPTSSNDDVSKPVVKANSSNDDVSKPVVKPTSPSNNVNKSVTNDVTPSKNNNPSFEEVQQAIFKIVNRERANAGKPALSYDRTMEKYAIMKSKDMAVRNYFDHVDLEGNLITKKINSDGVKYMAWGENIISRHGQINIDELAEHFMDRWMHSPGHKANILSDNFKTIGIGLYRIGDSVYGTQEFCKY